jgi:predicted ATP-grasp superfamily ATP-dependent carboligase
MTRNDLNDQFFPADYSRLSISSDAAAISGNARRRCAAYVGMNILSDAALDRQGGAVGALIVGGAHGSLVLARSLGRRGIPVWFLTSDHPTAKYSHYTSRGFSWAGPNHEGAVEFLLELASRHHLEGWVLMAAGDAEMRLLSQHKAELSSVFRVTVPPWDVVRWAHNKRLT